MSEMIKDIPYGVQLRIWRLEAKIESLESRLLDARGIFNKISRHYKSQEVKEFVNQGMAITRWDKLILYRQNNKADNCFVLWGLSYETGKRLLFPKTGESWGSNKADWGWHWDKNGHGVYGGCWYLLNIKIGDELAKKMTRTDKLIWEHIGHISDLIND